MEKLNNVPLTKEEIKHDANLIEKGFKTGKYYTEKEMKEKFGKFGWGK